MNARIVIFGVNNLCTILNYKKHASNIQLKNILCKKSSKRRATFGYFFSSSTRVQKFHVIFQRNCNGQ